MQFSKHLRTLDNLCNNIFTVPVDPDATLVSLSVLLSVAHQMISCKLLDNAVATVGQLAADLLTSSSKLQTNVDQFTFELNSLLN
jgi:hypothetical protein